MLSFDVTIDLSEIEALEHKLNPDDIIGQFAAIVNHAGGIAALHLKNLAAVRTGNLKRSIKWNKYDRARGFASLSMRFYGIPYFGKRKYLLKEY